MFNMIFPREIVKPIFFGFKTWNILYCFLFLCLTITFKTSMKWFKITLWKPKIPNFRGEGFALDLTRGYAHWTSASHALRLPEVDSYVYMSKFYSSLSTCQITYSSSDHHCHHHHHTKCRCIATYICSGCPNSGDLWITFSQWQTRTKVIKGKKTIVPKFSHQICENVISLSSCGRGSRPH